MRIKKAICLVIATLFALSAIQVMGFAADTSKDTGYSSHLPGEVTITFDQKVSPETQAKIYAHFNGEEPAAGTKGITCTLFGHKLETGYTTTITHKARASAPRCLEQQFYYEICTRCDYSNYTLLNSRYIHCCS